MRLVPPCLLALLALPVDPGQRLLKVVFLEAPFEGVVLPLSELLSVPLVLLAQPLVLCCHPSQTLCEYTVVAPFGSVLTQRCLPGLEGDPDALLPCERLSGRPDLHPVEDSFDQCVPGERGACGPTVQ